MKAPMRPGAREARLAEMLRVDHAGEYGAVQIYRGQLAVFDPLASRGDVAARLKEMESGEAAHLRTFDTVLAERRVRPTLLSPLWNAAGFALGAATALMGEKAAMAATAAVEDVIEKHYAEQAEELKDTEPALAKTITDFRNDELHHKATAEAHGAEGALGFPLMRLLIQAGCRAAIRLSEKI